MTVTRMYGREMLSALTEAGVIRQGDYVRRVIIDIEMNSAVIMHIERYGDTRLLNLVRTLDGIKILTMDGNEEKAK
jgi:hypothetical protein